MNDNENSKEVEELEKSKDKTLNLDVFYCRKAGMTRIFDESGNHVPVTVLELIENKISQIKTQDKDGYNAYQVAYYDKREKLIGNPIKGHLKKSGIEPTKARFSEVRMSEVDEAVIGSALGYDNFPADTTVTVCGTTKGKGFAGVMKKFSFSGGPATHGSKFHRHGGSIGNRATPGKVWKGKKMPGHLGVEKQTLKNLKVVGVNLEKGYMLVRGSIPGHKNSFVKITKA